MTRPSVHAEHLASGVQEGHRRIEIGGNRIGKGLAILRRIPVPAELSFDKRRAALYLQPPAGASFAQKVPHQDHHHPGEEDGSPKPEENSLVELPAKIAAVVESHAGSFAKT